MNGKNLLIGLSYIDQKYIEESEQDIPAKKAITPARNQRTAQSKCLSTKKIWLIAAVIALTLLLVGCAVAYAMIIFGSPAEMISALYGENTGFASAPPTEVNDPGKPGSAYTVPGYEKQPVEETVAQELEKWVSPVGKSITTDGYKLTVDAYIYDSTTQSGLITLLLEHDKPISEEELLVGYNGEIGGLSGNYLNFNQYGRAYLIPGKTTTTQLAFTYYFRADMRTGTNLLVSFPDFEESIELQALREQMEKDLTPNDAVQKLRSLWGDALVEETFADHMDDLSAGAYHFLALRAYEQAHSDEMVCISLPNSGSLPFKTFGQGDVYVNSLCVRIRTSHYTEPGGSNEKVIFHMTDGTDFVVVDNITDNTLFKRVIENDDTLYMLGSAINIDNIQSVEVIGNLGGATLEADTE